MPKSLTIQGSSKQMAFSNSFAIFSLPGNDELSLPESDSLLEEEQNLLDHENESTWLRDLADRTRFNAKPISSSLDLCNMCCKIFSICELSVDSNQSYRHHQSHESLIEAAQGRCYICSQLLENSTALFKQFPWPAIPGSRKQQWLSYSINRLIGGDFSISFLHNNTKRLEVEVLQLRVFSFCK
jgi:hypothetical protein